MTARADILGNKHDILKLKADKKTGAVELSDKLFENFVMYAKANWLYQAQPGAQKAADALAATGPATLACGTIREALKLMLREDLEQTAVNEDINSYFLTKPGLKCYDARVTGNLFDETGAGNALACHFSTHYFIKCNGKWYDPCLTAQYFTREGPVQAYTEKVGPTSANSIASLRKAGTGPALMVFKLEPGRSVPGFGSVWKLIRKNELKAAVTQLDLVKAKADPDLKAAKWV
ncbi:hypothetical protein DFR24_3037 [Panacagrimonas perspica]|uniref:Uncharacterized protein n=1 Tax=Panacagrimonas perspica TaxID=381431 RepID=A0A4R7P5C4_9GAMM|nr:hypothetical protein [Panacagrimonas perspica]TDU28662.1 hypothetical protein DFR24_3037 [Panacagrimonas perspica]